MKFVLIIAFTLSSMTVFAQREAGPRSGGKSVNGRLLPVCDAKASNRPCWYWPKPGSKDKPGPIE